jgi:hypothetical protein
MDEEYTGGMVISPGITGTSSGTGNYQRNRIPPKITSSWKRNPPEEWDSAGNNQLMEVDSDLQDQNA